MLVFVVMQVMQVKKRPEIMPASFMDTEIAHLVRLKSLGHWLLWCCQQALCRLE